MARLLVADDHERSRCVLAAFLEADSHELAFASDGHDVIDALGRGPVDLVLCDALMPGMDGFDVCRAIKAHPTWRYVPVMLVTALDGQDDLVRGIEAGADDFVSKPVDKVALRARVRALLRIRGQYEQATTRSATTERPPHREQVIQAANLSPREREVLDLVFLGKCHKEIAAALSISERTSKFHFANILQKLGADSRSDLMRIFL